VPAGQQGDVWMGEDGEMTGIPADRDRGVAERDRDAEGRARNARPRDELGRPLPYGSAGVPRAPEGIRREPAETLSLAQRLLDEGAPFHAHEVLEDAWKTRPPDESPLWRGLAQLAVGLTHLARGNLTGAAALLRRGAGSLSETAGPSPAAAIAAADAGKIPLDAAGVDKAAFVAWALSSAAELVAGRELAFEDVLTRMPRLRPSDPGRSAVP